MDLTFDKGNPKSPKGHAFLVLSNSASPGEMWATYLVVLPISIDLAKYVPPFLMGQLGDTTDHDLSAFAFPPFPEKIESYDQLTELAAEREDDVILAGAIDLSDVVTTMSTVNEALQQYADTCASLEPEDEVEVEEAIDESEGLGINEVMYSLMNDGDKLSELTKLVGRLRYAVEGGEEVMVREAESDILTMSRLLPENHQIPRLLEVAKAGGNANAELAHLYLQRCFHILREEYANLSDLDSRIRLIESRREQA